MKIAIVGSGISGMTAAWLLDQHHDVTVFERNNYLGGNWVTLHIDHQDEKIPVTPGLASFSNYYYKTLLKLIECLGLNDSLIACDPPVRYNRLAIKYPYKNLELSQTSRIYNAMIAAYIMQIRRDCKEIIENRDYKCTIKQFIERYPRYGVPLFVEFLFAVLNILGVKPADTDYMDTPIYFILKVMEAFKVENVYSVILYEFKSGPNQVIDKIKSECSNTKFHLSSEVLSVKEQQDKMEVDVKRDDKTTKEEFDFVLFATHPPSILQMMPTIYCKNYLQQLTYCDVLSVIHSDVRVMPDRRKNWPNFYSIFMPFFDVWVESSWLGTQRKYQDIFCTYAWNDLTDNVNLLNDVHHTMLFEYPNIDSASLMTHQYLESNARSGRVAIAGYWTQGLFSGEDGVRSAVSAVPLIDPTLKDKSSRYKAIMNNESKIPKLSFGGKVYEKMVDHVIRPIYFTFLEPMARKAMNAK